MTHRAHIISSAFCLVLGCNQLLAQTAMRRESKPYEDRYKHQTPREADEDRLSVAQDWLTVLGVFAEGPAFPEGKTLKTLDADEARTLKRQIVVWSQGNEEITTLPSLGEVDFDDLSSSPSERLERAFSVKIEGAQTSKYVYGVPYGAAAGTPTTYLANPDDHLFNYTGTINFGEMFLSVADRTATCKSVQGLQKAHLRVTSDGNYCDNYNFVTGDRNRDFAERLLSGLTLSYTASQNSKFQQKLVPADAPVTFSSSITGSFDPTKMWRSASDWEAAAGVYASRAKIEADGDKHRHNITPYDPQTKGDHFNDFPCLSLAKQDGCIERYAYGWHKVQILEALIPKIDVKAVTPLSIQAANNTFIAPKADEKKVLYTVAFSIDLTKFIPNAKTRASAANVMVALANEEAKRIALARSSSRTSGSSDWRAWRQKVAMMYLEIIKTPSLLDPDQDDIFWNDFRATVLKL